MKLRYHLLDNIRGVCIILVVWYHVLFNLSEIFGGNYAFFRSAGMDAFRDGFVGVLMVLAGISCHFTRSNLRRGIKTLAGGLLVTAVTAMAMPSQLITFGILHFFGCCMLLYAALEKVLAKIPLWPGAAVSFALYFACRGIYGQVTGMPRNFLLFALGFRTGHSSADYYPILPWVFLFLTGCFLGRLFARGEVPKVFAKNPAPALAGLGRHTMIIYLLHQPIVYGVMMLWFDFVA